MDTGIVEDLRGLRIGIVEGFEYTPEFDRPRLFGKVAGSSGVSFRRLPLGRADTIAGDLQLHKYPAGSDGRAAPVEILPKSPAMVPRCISVPKARADKAERLRAAYEKLKKDAVIGNRDR